jgi:hypothetical protein
MYDVDPRTGLWSHRESAVRETVSLSAFTWAGDGFVWSPGAAELPESVLDEQLDSGRELLLAAVCRNPDPLPVPELPDEYHQARWFPLPHEVASYLRARHSENPNAQSHFSRSRFEASASEPNSAGPGVGCAQG